MKFWFITNFAPGLAVQLDIGESGEPGRVKKREMGDLGRKLKFSTQNTIHSLKYRSEVIIKFPSSEHLPSISFPNLGPPIRIVIVSYDLNSFRGASNRFAD
jgi:hypothetical protein